MVGHADKGLAAADGAELLGQGLARRAGEGGVVEDAGVADGLDGVRVVDEADADEVLVLADLSRGLDVGPALGAGGGVEGLDECGEGLVATGGVAGDGGGVLDLLETEHVDVHGVDRVDDLRLLVVERGLGVGAAHVATVGRDGRAVAVVVGSAVLVLAQGGEVVEHVERGDGVVTRDPGHGAQLGGAGILPGDGQVGAGRRAGHRGGGLEAPELEAVVEHDGVLEGDRVAGADRLDGRSTVLGDVGQRDGLGSGGVVRGAAVVERDQAGVVLRLQRARLSAGQDHVGGLVQCLVAGGEAELAERVELVVVGHRVGTGGLEQHVLERLARLVTVRKVVDGQRGDGVERCGARGDRRAGQLGHAIELGDPAGDGDGLADGGVDPAITEVDEDRGRGGGGLGAGAAGLDDDAVLAAVGVHGGDHALGGDVLAGQRGGGARALDLGDRGDRARLDGIGRVGGIGRMGGAGAPGGALRGRRAHDEVGGVVVGVDGRVGAGDGGGVGGRPGCRALDVRGVSPADLVDHGGAVEQNRRGVGAGEGQVAGLVGSGQGSGGVGARGTRDQVVRPSGDGAGQGDV